MVSRDSFHRAYYGGMLLMPQNAEKQHRALNSSEFPCLFSRNSRHYRTLCQRSILQQLLALESF